MAQLITSDIIVQRGQKGLFAAAIPGPITILRDAVYGRAPIAACKSYVQ